MKGKNGRGVVRSRWYSRFRFETGEVFAHYALIEQF